MNDRIRAQCRKLKDLEDRFWTLIQSGKFNERGTSWLCQVTEGLMELRTTLAGKKADYADYVLDPDFTRYTCGWMPNGADEGDNDG